MRTIPQPKTQNPSPVSPHFPWFTLALVGIWVISLILRFWGLERFNTLVFDEVYYAKFANKYLIGEDFFNAHPPLSQYIIAIGIWIGSHLPFGQDRINGFTGSLRSTFSYRWLNAFIGSFLPLIVAAIAYQLTSRRSYSLIAAIFATVDGLFLVESRYALNNIYLVGFGLLGQLFLLLALKKPPYQRRNQLAIAGIFFGASAAIKWNGLGFLLGVYLIWLIPGIIAAIASIRFDNIFSYHEQVSSTRKKNFLKKWQRRVKSFSKSHLSSTAIANLTQLNFWQMILCLGIIPALSYSISWIPHLLMVPKPGFWEMQQEILTFHQNVGGIYAHPYCSRWYSWIFMQHPVAYFYHTARNTTETVPQYPPLPTGTGTVIYDVHAMGNPILWWLSSIAIFLLLLLFIFWLFWRGLGKISLTTTTWIALYLVCNYAANLLPWMKVSRCTFIYHYMSASVFAQLALAWIVERWISSEKLFYRRAGIAVVLSIILAFWFWLPIYLGLPLSEQGFQMRMWFSSWIN
ncbi:MAG: phospholipid carrier-dependent glycosyltransferase [Oscillatoria sp. PMC 1051.18]|nr:phospholipid carrier-dependent glycosyltransferase [Oscillatoria sp. PMC 1050.18]MEC5031323.1 phospholipid carrier-dependent glycosyltransferase [Oscillatoria sp. PMC 1051.18]